MPLPRILLALVAALLCASLAAPAASAKSGVRATLTKPLALGAKPGTRIAVHWRLRSADGRPFGAGGVFVELASASGGAATVGRAVRRRRGTYRARVVVPNGGIAAIRIGLMGWRYGPGGPRAGGERTPAPVYFPIVNDPFAIAGARDTPVARVALGGVLGGAGTLVAARCARTARPAVT